MATVIRDLAIALKLQSDSFTNGMRAAQKDAKELEKVLKPVVTGLKDVGVAASAMGLAIVGPLAAATRAAANYGDAIRDMSIRTGVATQQLAGYKLAAEQSGTSVEDLSVGLKKLAVNATEAARGNTQQIALFKEMGVTVKGANGAMLPLDKILAQVSTHFKGMTDKTLEADEAVKVFGKSGTNLTEFLELGSAGLAEFQKQAEKMGLAIGPEAAAQADKFNDNIRQMEAATLGLSLAIGNALLPKLNEMAVAVTNGVVKLKDFAAEHEDVTRTALATGTVLGVTGAVAGGMAALGIILPKVAAGFGFVKGGIDTVAAAGRSLTILNDVEKFGELGTALTLIGETSTLAAGGLVAVSAALGVGIGLLIDYAIAGTRVEAALDGFTKSLQVAWGSESEMLATTTAAADVLKNKYGVAIDRGNMSIDQWRVAVTKALQAHQALDTGLQENIKNIRANQTAVNEFLKTIGGQGPALKATGDLIREMFGPKVIDAEALKKAEEAAKKFREQVDAMKESADKLKETKALETALVELQKAGVPAIELVESLGKKALELAQALDASGKPVPPLIESLANATQWLDETKKAMESNTDAGIKMGAETEEQARLFNRMGQAMDDLIARTPAYVAATKKWGEALPLNVPGVYSPDTQAPDVQMMEPVVPNPNATPFDWPAQMRDQGLKAIDEITNDMSKMFTDMIGHGKSFWESFKSLGTNIFASIADQFLKTMLHSFLNPFAESLGRALDKAASAAASGAKAGSTKDSDGNDTSFSLSGLIKGGAIAAATTAAIAGVVALGHAITGMFHQLAAQASAFVKSTQDPFTAATTSMFDTLEAARAAGTLTVAQVKEASAGFEKMWADFQAAAAKQGVVGQQALATMGPFVAQWEDWLKSLAEAGKELERQAAIKGFSDRLTDAAKSLDPLNIAIGNLVDGGYSAAQVMKFLGGDIQSMIDVCKALNIELPSSVQFMSDFIDSLKAMDRVKAIDAELQSISDQIGQALTSKMDLLDGQMQKSKDNIANWTTQIATLDQQIADQSKNLNDASYWQKQYDDAVKASADNLQQLTDKRKSLEQQISTLETEMQRQALVDAVEKAKGQGQAAAAMFTQTFAGITKAGHVFAASLTTNLGGGMTGNQALADAQAALDAFDKQQAELAKQQKAIQLNDLRQQLAETITAQAAARDAYADASVAAQEHIHQMKSDMEAGIALAKFQEETLKNNIALETLRIAAIQKDIDATQRLMDTMGVQRTDEITKINNTIAALTLRAVALANERAGLEALYGASLNASAGITALINALRNAFTQQEQNFRASQPAYSTGIPGLPNRTGPPGIAFPSLAVGGEINRSGMVFVHAGERVIPAEVAQGGKMGGGGTTVNVYVDGNVTSERDLQRTIEEQLTRRVKNGQLDLPASRIRRSR